MLPDGSGLDLLVSLRRAGDESPILFLTALDEARDRVSVASATISAGTCVVQ